MIATPKYALGEFERRFLVLKAADLPEAVRPRRIIDRYIIGTRLRLRSVQDEVGGPPVYKLCKKYGEGALASALVNIYLTHDEYQLLQTLPACEIRKQRSSILDQDTVFCVDRFEGKLAGLVLAEVECADALSLSRVSVPIWVSGEVTDDEFFTGGNLSTLDAEALHQRLANWSALFRADH